jgi:hypothetical protein
LALGVIRIVVVYHDDADSGIQETFISSIKPSQEQPAVLERTCRLLPFRCLVSIQPEAIAQAEEQLHLDPTRSSSPQSISSGRDLVNRSDCQIASLFVSASLETGIPYASDPF